MSFLTEIKNKLKSTIGNQDLIFSYPPRPELGDLSLACFNLSKNKSSNPADQALALAKTLKKDKEIMSFFAQIEPTGPYLNFFFKPELLAEKVLGEIKIKKEKYGHNKNGEGRKIMIEYSNGNTHKECHIGHLRNIAYGDSIYRLLMANGYGAIPVSYLNDFGIHVAKTLWHWKKNPAYANQTEPKGYLLGKCYAEASQKLKERPEYQTEVVKIMQDIESREGENYQLWKETRNWSLEYYAEIYKDLGIKFSKYFYESEVIDEGLKMVNSLLEKGILKKSEGAIIADLEKYNLGILPIIRSDGTALYPVADLALAVNKFSLFDLEESIYVVDVRQSLYFKQLFKVLELLGYKQKLVHLPYDFVTLPEGMMSSRSGNIITYQELKNKIKIRLEKETAKRHEDWDEEKVAETAWTLTKAIIKFEMLKTGADKIITFNIEEALKFEGYTACYLEYSYARLKSILRKESNNYFLGKTNLGLLTEIKEKELLIKIARYPEIIIAANDKKNPSELTKYLFELAQLSNDYYHAINILKAEKRIKKARLSLIRAISQTIKNGLNILGIEVLEEM
ncbi:MAG: arginine--tRNA ligase [Patescibacteria group bacterium]|jgi:arginyl-tRNA synthetase|nr:arginine--tRNA ligase [bacterium]HQC50026.1 arginine--tRNA ligase [bacterium]